MNSQLLILIFTTGLFMSMWDSDRQHATTVVALAARKAESRISADAELAVSASGEQHPFPIPRELTAGTWEVHQQHGSSYRIVVPSDGKTGTGPRYLIRTGTDGREWCYIRRREAI